MDIRKVKKLIELIEESDIAEIEIHEGEESVRINRYSSTQPVAVTQAPAPIATTTISAAPQAPSANKVEELSGHVITSPMVGTYYDAPSPGSSAFVKLGQTVQKGDTLCIIEAMKILNQIEADKSGVVASILAENGHPVEFDQPLFIIE
ncbi:MAG: acetyl-CoA carboxylase biotin carboxyl carrier protein [Cycloclasticus sp.]|jgi:acetyl-CoA carboxylase biotin carboxyl carrier protein|nr:MAG: acetyl-CoA carboxylase biotin carboxyl carrier protein subunit [Cycloclasticus sp. Phe_18]MBV1912956.1 acetyl-CoA carboxylase biotin carboxyl carrier protein [Cycloclasticus sp.]MDF1689435.1 acetyl-CoA carboxylase biotin carboxyl carrier protein [Cycloclasticus sp.]MEE4291318.1 acetyl-CoA carboxylase biotin carboxyl carrier protein [Cycloclasticus sp.]